MAEAGARRFGAWLLALLAVAALGGVMAMALRAPPRPTAGGGAQPPAAPLPVSLPQNHDGPAVPGPPPTALAPAVATPVPRPPSPPVPPPSPAPSPDAGLDDEAFVRALRARPESVVRAEVEEVVGKVPGAKLVTWNCKDGSCQTNVHADAPETFDLVTRELGQRYRGHIAVVASVDNPAAPDRVVGSIFLATDEAHGAPALGNTWSARD